MSKTSNHSKSQVEVRAAPETHVKNERAKAGLRQSSAETAPTSNASMTPAAPPTTTPSSRSAAFISLPPRSRSKRSSTADTITSSTRDTRPSTTSPLGELEVVLNRAATAQSLFDLRRAFYLGGPQGGLPQATEEEWNGAIRTRLATVTSARGENLASCATRGLDAVRDAFALQDVLGAIAGPLGREDTAKLGSGPGSHYASTTASEIASSWISKISTQWAKLNGSSGTEGPGGSASGASGTSKKRELSDGSRSAGPSKTETDTKVRDPKAFDTLILDYVRGEIEKVLADQKRRHANKQSFSTKTSSTAGSAKRKEGDPLTTTPARSTRSPSSRSRDSSRPTSSSRRAPKTDPTSFKPLAP